MKVIIFKIVASPAFITCALNPSLVSAAVTIPPPALAAPSTPNVSPGERRLEPIEANGNEERAPSPEVIANAAKELPSASTLGNVVSGVMKIASGTVSAAQGTANMWSRLFWDIIKMGPQFLLVGEKREILMAMHAASLILDNGQRDALEGVRYLRIVAEQWKTKTLTEVVQLLDPSKEKLDPFTLVVLGNLANLRRKAPDEMKNLLTKTPARSKGSALVRGFTSKVPNEDSTPSRMVADALTEYYKPEQLFHDLRQLIATKNYGDMTEPILKDVFLSWSSNDMSSTEFDKILRTSTPSLSKKEIKKFFSIFKSVTLTKPEKK